MANILYMAISKDGYIAGPNDETPWSDESWAAFVSFVQSCDKVLLGRRSYEIMRDADDFVEGPEYIVASNDPDYDAGSFATARIVAPEDLPQTGRLGIIGGGELNGQLAEMGVIDEIYLDIEPIELHRGTKLFGYHEPTLKLKPLGSRLIGDATVQRHYQVVR